MSNIDDSQRCDFCKNGNIVIREEEIAFRQCTDRGYIVCRATAPIGICDNCGSNNWDEAAEAIIEEAVRKEYEKLL